MAMFALAGIPGVARAEPLKCDLAIAATPPTIPEGSRVARVIIPAGHSDIQLRASSGTVSEPAGLDSGSLVAEFTAAAKSPPVALVAAVSWSACGFSVVRIAAAASVPAGGAPVTLVVVEPPVARANLDVEVLVYVFAVDGRGAPRRGKAPAFRPSVGIRRRRAVARPGCMAWALAHPSRRSRRRRREGRLRNRGARLGIPGAHAGSARGNGITQDPASGAGGRGTPTAVLARIQDSAGNLTDGPLELESDVAQMGAPVRLERGVFRAPLVVPPGTQDKTLLIMARADRAIATATFSIAPSVAAAVRVTRLGLSAWMAPPGRSSWSSRSRWSMPRAIP